MNILQTFIESKGGTTISGISFYYCEGQLRMRHASGPSKKQIKTKASCKPIRENNSEFGFASQFSRSLRTRIGSGLKDFADSQISGRLTGLIRGIIKQGSGVAGQREFNPCLFGAMLLGFEFNRHADFSAVWHSAITCTPVEDSNTYLIQTTLSSRLIHAPADATHVRFTAISLAVPVMAYDVVRRKYASDHARSLDPVFKENACIHFETISLTNPDAVGIEMRVSGLNEYIEKKSGVMVILYGVHFYNGDVLLREGAVMKIGEVFDDV